MIVVVEVLCNRFYFFKNCTCAQCYLLPTNDLEVDVLSINTLFVFSYSQ